jgi:hypothetical protein
VILPLPVSSVPLSSEETIISFVTGLLLLPLAAVLVTLATPSFESWALSLRQQAKLRWWHDDAPPHVAFAAMSAVFIAALVLRLPGYPSAMGGREQWAFVWAMGVAMTLPVFALFGSTRYHTVASRFAFSAAVFAHLLYQIVIIGIFGADHSSRHSPEMVAIEIGALLSLAVPAWVIFRQVRLAQRVRAGTT